MASRRDLMRIIRKDETFAAKLGFGSEAPVAADGGEASEATPNPEVGRALGDPRPPDAAAEQEPAAEARSPDTRSEAATAESLGDSTAATSGQKRSVVIYVAVSLNEELAARAERWAAAASCSVPLLMRQTAQALRKELFDIWRDAGVEQVVEQRGRKRRYPTSITLTLPPDLADALSMQVDPLGVIGLGRAISPVFRARFELAFDAAAKRAGF